MRDFRFTDKFTGSNVDAIATLLIQPRLWIPGGDYPAHTEWRDKALAQAASGQKRTMLAWWGDEPVGSIIYQRHPNDPTTAEIRNLSVERHARGRHVADFLLQQALCEMPVDFPGVTSVITDTKLSNTGFLAFAINHGFTASLPTIVEGTFAHNGEPDVVLTKQLDPSIRL